MKKKSPLKSALPVPRQDAIAIAIPNTTQDKMRAIISLCTAIEKVAEALSGTQVEVKVSGCTFQGTSGNGINIIQPQ